MKRDATPLIALDLQEATMWGVYFVQGGARGHRIDHWIECAVRQITRREQGLLLFVNNIRQTLRHRSPCDHFTIDDDLVT
jgi:hypothetical protein